MLPTHSQIESGHYPAQLRAKEEELILRRRAQVDHLDQNAPCVGVACSGGGIRSATVCLGVFQALAKNDALRRVDYISTISGGGYFGSFLGGLFVPRPKGPVNPGSPLVPQSVKDVLCDDQSPPIKWLREHGRYIAPNGPADYANMAAVYIRNWIGLHFVVGVSILTLFFLLLFIRAIVLNVCTASCGTHRWLGQLGYSAYLDWSPFILLPLAFLLLRIAPLGWSFWLTQYGTDRNGVEIESDSDSVGSKLMMFRSNPPFWATLFVLVVCVVVLIVPAVSNIVLTTKEWASLWAILLAGLLALVYWVLAEIRAPRKWAEGSMASAHMPIKRRHALVRNLLSDQLGVSLKIFVVLTAIGVVDSLAQTIYNRFHGTLPRHALTASTIGGILLALAHQLGPYLKSGSKTMGSRWSLWTIASIAGIVLLGLIVLGWDLVAYGLAFRGQPLDTADIVANQVSFRWYSSIDAPSSLILLITIAIYLGVGLCITLLTARTLSFINLSSLQGFYSARLRRAYLGASNSSRTGYRKAPGPQMPALQCSIRREVSGDDMAWSQYDPQSQGGPLHLMGVTVNQTVGPGSDIDLRDRKGLTMTIGPAGMSAAIDSHALWQGSLLKPIAGPGGQNPIFGSPNEDVAAEPCPLSRWMAVSGAAFSTGLGSRTKTGISILLGTANIRLGYWWASGAQTDRSDSILLKLFRPQAYLYGEFMGEFSGPELRHWYLSDGGHSENTGAYELIRRQLPIIFVLDNGADPDYEFEDFANLVRRVRIDFGSEITPCTASDRQKVVVSGQESVFGPIESMRRSLPGAMGIQLAMNAISLFVVTYKTSQARSLLVLVKPTLVGDEPKDVVNYAVEHPTFPQEPTSDQFFDEPQWESYRRLGECIGSKLCAGLDLTKTL